MFENKSEFGRVGLIQLTVCMVMGVSVLLSSGCDEQDNKAAPSESQMTVAVTIYPLADLTQQLVGDQFKVVCLLPPGQSPHGFEAGAKQMQAISEAGLVVAVGLDFDLWADRAAEAAGKSKTQLFHVADSMGLSEDHKKQVQPDGDGHAHEKGTCTDPSHNHGTIDPHVWLDPVLIRQMLPDLTARLVKTFPKHAKAIQANSLQLDARLKQLDKEYIEQLSKVQTKEIVTFHSAFNRLCKRYGLTVVATLRPIEAAGEVTSKQLQQTINAIQTHKLKVIFAEPQIDSRAAKTISEQYGVAIKVLDPLGDPHRKGYDGYFQMMQSNLKTLSEALNL